MVKYRADALQAQLAGEKARAELLQTGFHQASAEAQAARDRVETAERDEAARRARGLLERILAAVRGE
jgi:hypothetical protein